MVSVIPRLSLLVPTACSLPGFAQPRRYRYVPDPGTLDQRLFRAVTKPVYQPPTLTRQEKYLILQEEYLKRMEQNPYRNFLIRRAQEDFYGYAEDKMMLIFQPLYYYPWEMLPVKNKLLDNGLRFKGFPIDVLKEGARGTKWQTFVDVVLKDPIPNKYLFGEADPKVCSAALSITSRTRFLILLGGVIHDRIMTREEVRNFADLGDLPSMHARLLGTLTQSTSETAQLLNHHQGELASLLKSHAQALGAPPSSKQSKAPTRSKSSSSSTGEDSDSDSSSSDSSDSDS